MNEQLLLGFGVVIVIIAGIFAFRSFSNRHRAKEEAKEFLASLEDHMYTIFIKIIKEINTDDFNTLEEYEKYTVEKIYDGLWEFIDKKIQESENKDLISVLARKFLTKENVEKYIREYLDRVNTKGNLENTYGVAAIEEKSEEMIEEDKELSKKYSDQSQFNEEVDKNSYEYEAAKEPEHTEEEKASLNPQKDIDEEDYSDDDSSVELIKSYVEYRINRAGRPMYYLVDEMGKKMQISKQRALDSGFEIREIK